MPLPHAVQHRRLTRLRTGIPSLVLGFLSLLPAVLSPCHAAETGTPGAAGRPFTTTSTQTRTSREYLEDYCKEMGISDPTLPGASPASTGEEGGFIANLILAVQLEETPPAVPLHLPPIQVTGPLSERPPWLQIESVESPPTPRDQRIMSLLNSPSLPSRIDFSDLPADPPNLLRFHRQFSGPPSPQLIQAREHSTFPAFMAVPSAHPLPARILRTYSRNQGRQYIHQLWAKRRFLAVLGPRLLFSQDGANQVLAYSTDAGNVFCYVWQSGPIPPELWIIQINLGPADLDTRLPQLIRHLADLAHFPRATTAPVKKTAPATPPAQHQKTRS